MAEEQLGRDFMMGGTLSMDLERLVGATVLVSSFFRIVPWEDILAVSHDEKGGGWICVFTLLGSSKISWHRSKILF